MAFDLDYETVSHFKRKKEKSLNTKSKEKKLTMRLKKSVKPCG